MAIINMEDQQPSTETVETVIEAPAAAVEPEISKLQEKTQLLGISMILTGFSTCMTVASITSLIKIQRVMIFIGHSRRVPTALTGFRVVIALMIILACLQLCANLRMTVAVFKNQVAWIFRMHSNYTISCSLMCGFFWLLVLAIFIYEIQLGSGLWLGFAVFFGGFAHAGLIIYFFMGVECQKPIDLEKKPSNDFEILKGSTYQKF